MTTHTTSNTQSQAGLTRCQKRIGRQFSARLTRLLVALSFTPSAKNSCRKTTVALLVLITKKTEANNDCVDY